MKKVLYIIMCVVGIMSTYSCSDFLEPKSDSETDAEFVFSNSITARAAIEGAYEQWRATANSYVFGAGLFYAADAAGSDIERHPEGYAAQPLRHIPETFYENGKRTSDYDVGKYDQENGAYSNLFAVIGQANAIISAVEKKDNFKTDVIDATKPNFLSQLYGEAVALRATAYRELIKYYGDVPYVHTFGVSATSMAGRDSIYDACLADLKVVEKNMYDQGEIPNVSALDKHYFSKQYVQGLIGRMALEAAGYQTRRTDGTINYTNGEGKALTFETKGTPNQNAQYGRRADWKDLVEIARVYFKKVIDNHPGIKFNANDFSEFFLQMMSDDAIYADESIYEYPMQWNSTSDERAYSSGRPSNGGSKAAYPCKDYGQCRINPAYYYGIFDPQDKRRDLAVTCTGSDGKGYEVLIPFTPGSKSSAGGLSMNKWDENRQTNPNTLAQRKSGINGPYMRMSEIYLGYAEACALLGGTHDNEAKTYLTLIRKRAFTNPNVDAFITACGNLYPQSGYSPLYKAIIEERGFEFAGEGDRRWTLIRTGILPEAIKRIKELTKEMIDGLEKNGSYTFANGNVISASVYTKAVDAKALYGKRLTEATPAGQENDPVLFPGWRGQNNNWESFGCDYKGNTKTNLAIQGLFKPVADPAALIADGYKEVAWGSELVKQKAEYYDYLFTNYDYVSTPIYLWPITPNQLATGGYVNGYGFPNTVK